MTAPKNPTQKIDAVTTPMGLTTMCPQCGASLDALTTACGRCGAVITGGGVDGDRAERVRARLQGQIGDQFRIGALIGRGGMGIVFLAREVALDREVALKVLAFDPVLNPDAFTRFEREARLAARLDHPNIVPIFAVGQGEGVAYYTMRFVRGGSLEALVMNAGPLALDHAVKLLRDVASALDFAHAQGVVHRDIKPANILLADSGHAMVADFGIARAFTGDAGASNSGSHTGVVGSPAYMAPEQWRGERPDGRADQYALGVLAFELLTGRRPFADPSMQELLRKHLDAEPPSLDTVRKGLPAHVSRSIQRAMAKDPADRFPSTTAFVDALAGDVAVGVLKTRHRAHPGERGRQWFGNAMAAALVLTAGAVGWVGWRTLRETPVAPAVRAVTPGVDTLAERLARELDETRAIALDAERRAQLAESRERKDAGAGRGVAATAPKAAAPVIGFVNVSVRDGSPRLLVDGEEVAGSTPATIALAVGRHVVRVAEQGRQYLPAQYVIDVAAGDTSQVQFVSQRVAHQMQQQGQPMQFLRGGGGTPGATGTPDATPEATASPGGPAAGSQAARVSLFDMKSTHPYFINDRHWQQMPPAQQAKAQARWNRMTPEQRRKAIRAMIARDHAGGAPAPGPAP